MGTVILGTGSCLPEKRVTNHDLEEIVDTSAEWIQSRTGINARRISGKGEQTYNLATEASRKALLMSGIDAKELDIIVVATISSHMLMPSCACFVQKELGATKAFAYDVNAACSGFLYALDLGDKYVRADSEKKILIVGAEVLSARLNWADRNTCILFGDGAGAVIIGHQEGDCGYIGSNFFSDGNLWKLLYMHAPKSNNPELCIEENPGSHIIMEGREIFKYAVKAMEDAVRGLLAKEQISLDSVKLVIPHQANIRILNNLIERLEIPKEKVFINVAEYGNTSAASIPIALDEAKREGRISAGDTILFCTFGGGLTWGATLIKW